MKVKLDENLDESLSSLLAEVSEDVASVPAQRLGGRSDEVIHAVCVAEGRVLITLDLDFSNPIRFPCDHSAGIVVLRPHKTTLPQIRALMTQLSEALKREAPTGCLWVLEPGRVRVFRQQQNAAD